MAEYHLKMCRICLSSDIEDNISDWSCYTKFFIQVMAFNNFNEKLLLCIWCKAALKRAMALFKLALETENSFHSKNPKEIPIKLKKLHSMKIIHNSHIDIQPLLIEYQECNNENILQEIEELTNPLLEIQEDDEIPKTLKSTDNSNKESISKTEPNLIENGISILKRNEKTKKSTANLNEELILNTEQDFFENRSAIKKRNKKTKKSTDISNEESISNSEHECQQFKNGISRKKRKTEEFYFNELKFEVQYLSFEEQLKEIELKKLKYKDFNFQCDECGTGFLTSDLFEEHKVRHTKISGDHKCSLCGLHFKSRDVLSQHTLAHRRRYVCSLCSRSFTRCSHCVAHSYKCGAIVTPVACLHCAKLFSNEYALKIHMKVHKTEKKYCCDQCDRKFVSKQRLTVHMRSHSGIKPFSCTVCSRHFTTRSNLRAHSAVHDPNARHYCVECHTYYKTEKSLKRHFKESSKHAGMRSEMYSCQECTKQFSTESSLNHHISSRHGTEYRCAQCDKTFSNNSNLNKHIKCIHSAK